MSETDLTQARLWDLYKECEGRIGPSFLTILLVSVIYWLSFLLFVFDPQRALIPSAREFVRIVDQLEQSHVMWQARYVSDIEQAITIGDRYVEKIQTQPPNSRPNLPPINLDVQLKISDRMLVGLVRETSARSFEDLIKQWLEDIKSLKVNRIALEPEIGNVRRLYYVLNQHPGWIQRILSALGAESVAVPAPPSELNNPKWSEEAERGMGILFLAEDEFLSKLQSISTLYQGEITDRMQAKALMGQGIWIRNMDSGRSIARQIVEHEPSIRLPLIGENLTGRWAFIFAPALYLVLVRYLRSLLEREEAIKARMMHLRKQRTPDEAPESGTGEFGHRGFPHLLTLLDPWLRDIQGGNAVDELVNRFILLSLLALPVSTVIPVTTVNLWTETFPANIITGAGSLAYGIVFYDTLKVIQRVTVRKPQSPT